MTDLETRYLGLELRSPLVASASPLSGTADGVRRLADGGAAAVVLPSLFEEQLRQQAAHDAGAAAIELNIYYLPGDPFFTGSDVEQRHIEILTTVKAVVSVPVAVKLSPYFSSTGEMARRLDRAGADGLVLFNRFLQPDIDPETLAVTARPGLSTPAEGRLPRAWIALLAGRVRASLAATTGVETAADVAKYLLAGADVVMTASALLRHGPGYAGVLLNELSAWMTRKGFRSVAEVRGLLAVPDGTDQAAYERAGYVTALAAANKGFGPG